MVLPSGMCGALADGGPLGRGPLWHVAAGGAYGALASGGPLDRRVTMATCGCAS